MNIKWDILKHSTELQSVQIIGNVYTFAPHYSIWMVIKIKMNKLDNEATAYVIVTLETF